MQHEQREQQRNLTAQVRGPSADLVAVTTGGAGTFRHPRQDGRTEGQLVLDLTMQAIQASLDGLAARQRISAQNLANSETPGYTAQTVNFEDSLSAALASGDPTKTTISTGVSSDPPNINGNNVSVDTETISMIDTGLKYQLATQEMNNKFRILHDSTRQDL
jgi:flagellar basal-body rod protein FlgB